MGRLWELVQEHKHAQVYPPSDRQIAARLGLAPNALAGWRNPRKPPQPENLRRLAELMGVPEGVVIRAALIDTGYLPDETPADDGAQATER